MLLKEWYDLQWPPIDNRARVMAVLHCDCVVVQQIRSLKLGTGARLKMAQVRARELREGLRCVKCSGSGVGAMHRQVLHAMKSFLQDCAGQWVVLIEFALEPDSQSSKRVDVVILHADARSWDHAVAVEIDPKQHDINPIRYKRSRAVAERGTEQKDGEKQDLCSALGLRFMYLGHQSFKDGVIDPLWWSLLRDELQQVLASIDAL